MLEQKITTASQPNLKSKHDQILDIIDEVTQNSKKLGIAHLYTEDESYNGKTVTLNSKPMLNFGSCSYLGLEIDERLKKGAIDATQKFGVHYSSSRAYVSCGLYSELESLMEKIFGGYVNITHTTTLGHMSNIPVLVGDNDIVLMDSQVHESVNLACQLLKTRNIPVEVTRHNRMDILEDKIKDLSNKYEKVWYMADGVYSMYGDYTPVAEIRELLDKYEQFNFYVDDAHGMSWSGPNGSGYVNGTMGKHPRCYLTTSLGKGPGVGGAVLVYNDERTRDRVRNCGGTFIFSGPIQPPVLGALIESAKIHLSPEIYERQAALKERITYYKRRVKELGLPLIGDTESPIFFTGVGKPTVGYNMVKRLVNLGFFINLSVFPSVSYNKTGLRTTITLHHTFEDIDRMLTAMADQLPYALNDTNQTMKDIYKAFRLKEV
jgi:7-keto-8-aminopelargonate synthetase-like enzyme